MRTYTPCFYRNLDQKHAYLPHCILYPVFSWYEMIVCVDEEVLLPYTHVLTFLFPLPVYHLNHSLLMSEITFSQKSYSKAQKYLLVSATVLPYEQIISPDLGDFNICLLKNDSRPSSLRSVLEFNNFTILPFNPTHNMPNRNLFLLDLNIVSSAEHLAKHGQYSTDLFLYPTKLEFQTEIQNTFMS